MKTKITKTVKEWLPDLITDQVSVNEYELLGHLATYCQKQFADGKKEEAKQVMKIIALLYSSGNLHDRNAIENEFLGMLAEDESPASLKEHLQAFPEKLKSAYLKTILEN